MTQEIGSRLLSAHLEYRSRNIVIGEAMQVINPPAAIDVGYGFNIKYE
jgi:hypothetical protein